MTVNTTFNPGVYFVVEYTDKEDPTFRGPYYSLAEGVAAANASVSEGIVDLVGPLPFAQVKVYNPS